MSEPQPESRAEVRSRIGVLRFGPFELEPALDELRQAGATLPIHGQPLQVLELLLRSPGAVVSREALRRAVWSDGTVVEFDDGLNSCVSRLRQVLGDPPLNPSYIETIPRRGYRFLGEVIVVPGREEAATPHLTPASDSSAPESSSLRTVTELPASVVRAEPVGGRQLLPGRSLRKRLLVAVAALFLVALGAFVQSRVQSGRRPPLPQIEQVTARQGFILAARFTPEGRFVVSALWDGQPEELFSSAPPGDVQLLPLGLKDARVVGVSRTGELAVILRPGARTTLGAKGTLARVPGTGGTPRELAEGVVSADWSPGGDLVAVRVVGANYRIERPLGTPVYEISGGFISDLRVSPDGKHVAFVHSPRFMSTGSQVMVLDSHNAARALSRTYFDIEGLAWSPSGGEVWFTAGDFAKNTLRAAPLNQTEYEVYRSPGEMRLQDIAADGTVLFEIAEGAWNISLLAGSSPVPRSLSGFGGGFLAALSDDGQLLVFSDYRPPSTSEFVLVRQTDGSPPKYLGEGHALDLSADKRTVLASPGLGGPGLILLPVGAGMPTQLPTPGLEVDDARLFRDGKRVILGAHPTGASERRVFLLEVGSDAGARPISEVSVAPWPCLALSPDERSVAVNGGDGTVLVLPIVGGGSPVRIQGVSPEPGVCPIGWSAAGDLWLLSGRDPPAQLFRVDPRTRQVKETRQLSPGDPTGVLLVWGVRITPDGKTLAFSFGRARSRLYVMRGVGVPKN
jgi:DNA-binding winged helix-turn-helix (wHTH) protein